MQPKNKGKNMDRREILKTSGIAAIATAITGGNLSTMAEAASKANPPFPRIDTSEGMSNPTFLPSESDLVQRWEKTGLLQGLSSPHGKRIAAYAMENQRVWNQVSGDFPGKPTFARISIPVVRRLVGKMLDNNWNVDSKLSFNEPKINCIEKHNGGYPWDRDPLDAFKEMHSQYSLDAEAERVVLFVESTWKSMTSYINASNTKRFGGISQNIFYFYCLGYSPTYSPAMISPLPTVKFINAHQPGTALLFYEFDNS